MKKPQIVEEWEQSVKAIEEMAPKCCHTCTHEMNGRCLAANGNKIPAYFLDKIDECDGWTRESF